MNADMVAEITKLVIEKLERNQVSASSLSDSEIERWNDITTSMQQPASQYTKAGAQGELAPLNSEELRSWNAISEQFRNRTLERQYSSGAAGQVKFYSQH